MTDRQARIDWVDYAKGISIILVVMMHSTLSVEEALHRAGFAHEIVAFAQPFRIPAFFLVAGLFVSRSIDAPWRDFLDRKILHFAYFYVLWLTIQFVFRAPGFVAGSGVSGLVENYLLAFIDPFGTLWFIYLLPVFFLAARLTRGLPPALVLLAGALLEIAPIETQWTLIDEFAGRFVYFYAGYRFGPAILKAAPVIAAHRGLTLASLAVWAGIETAAVKAGIAHMPLVSLALGFAGAAAVVAISVLLAQVHWFRAIRYCGENSIVIYLGFFLPMATTRVVLAKSGLIADPGIVAMLVTLAAVITPLILHWLVRGTRFSFLFERPQRFRLVKRRDVRMQPAE